MTPWTIGEIADLRRARRQGRSMRGLCNMFYAHTRDEIMEAVDATRRWPEDHDARAWVNSVLAHQAAGDALINGRPAAGMLPARAF